MMTTVRRLLAVPLALVATIAAASASEIRDGAGMFSAAAVREAESILDRSERSNGHPIVIETVPSLEGRSIQDAAINGARRSGSAQVYVLLAKQESKFWVLERDGRFTPGQAGAVKAAFLDPFKHDDFDAGLINGSKALATEAASLPALRNRGTAPAARRGAPVPQRGGGSGMGTLLTLGLIVLAVLFGMRLLGRLFGGGAGAGGGYGGPGMRPGMGGYGPGYGGGGGGMFSSILGGLGGALAGNWMYDQFRGRGHENYNAGDASGAAGADPAANENADWGGGFGGDWGGGGSADAGGDWGGGGGGDWGGGGGDGGGGGWS